jgi:hypothetical protein
MTLAFLDIQGVSAFDYAQNRGLYFCRSVFEVYLRDKNPQSYDGQSLTARTVHTSNSILKSNGSDVAPTPPVNGRAKFIRHNNRRALTESLPPPTRSSPILSVEPLSHTTGNHPTSLPVTVHRSDEDEDDDAHEANRQRHRPPSSTASNSMVAPPVKPRKSSTTPNSSLVNTSRPQQNHRHHHVVITSAHSDDDEPNSLDGYAGHSDFDDENEGEQSQSPRFSRPSSRLSSRHSDDRLQLQLQQQQQQSNAMLRRPHYKQSKQANRQSIYDDYRFLEEQQQQQQQASASARARRRNRSASTKEFPQPSSNRLGSGNGNQPTTSRLKSGSRLGSNESIPSLDLTVAGQKVFRNKQQTDAYPVNASLPPSGIRPPSGRLKPISSAKSTSSYNDDLSPMSPRALEDVTNNVKPNSALPTKTHLYKKRLAPLTNSNDSTNKKHAHRLPMDQQAYAIDDVPSDRSEETSGGTSAGGRDIRSSSGSDKRSKHH